MARRFSRSRTKRTRYKLTPKEADEVIRKEFIDSRGNKFIHRIIFSPQSPLKPDYKQTVEYKDNEE